MRRFLFTALVLQSIVACGGEAPTGADPFVCTPAACPAGSCKLTITFADDCGELVDGAEVYLAGALEPGTASVGSTYVSTGDIPVPEIQRFWVRSERIQWGPLDLDCKDPSTDGGFTLSCKVNEGSAEPTN